MEAQGKPVLSETEARQATRGQGVRYVLAISVTPAIVAMVIHLPTAWARGIVIAAGCPTGVNTYLVASRFKTGEGLASSAITLTTALAVVTISFWLKIVEWL